MVVWLSNEVDDENIADEQASKGEEINKDEKRKIVDQVDCVRVHTKEEVDNLVFLNHTLRIALNDHISCALVKLEYWMLLLLEHEGLWGGQEEGHDP